MTYYSRYDYSSYTKYYSYNCNYSYNYNYNWCSYDIFDWLKWDCGDKPEVCKSPPVFVDLDCDEICIPENTTFVLDLDATDKDGDALTYSITGGADAAFFTIDAETGELSFAAPPDYEAPKDSNGNNIYKVTVTVTDSDGCTDEKTLKIEVCDVDEGGGNCKVIEAEDMYLCGYKVEYRDSASGDKNIVLSGNSGWAATRFEGADGSYDLKLTYMDESDGKGAIQVYVNGTLIKCIWLNQNNDGDGGSHSTWSEIKLEDIDLKDGDIIKLKGYGQCAEYARIDKIEICGNQPDKAALGDFVWYDTDRDGIQDAGEAGVENVLVTLLAADGVTELATTHTDATGHYLFDELDAGDYFVQFGAEDEFVFTTRDAGTDDAVDSDASASGRSHLVSLDWGETDLTIDAGIFGNETPDAMDDSGKVCATETTTIAVLDNDTDDDGDSLSVAQIAGTAVTAGDSVTLASGAVVTLNADGTLDYDSSGATYGGTAAADLLIGTQAADSFTYTVDDGFGGADTANVDVTICGAKNTLETIEASLPDSIDFTISPVSAGPLRDGFTVTLSNSGDARFDGLVIEEAYCLSAYEATVRNVPVSSEIYVGTEDLAAGSSLSPDILKDLDMINWIINQDFTSLDNGDGTSTNYSDTEVQGAIWSFTDNILFVPAGTGTAANAQEIIDLALLNGEGFEPGENDLLTFVLDPEQPSQSGHEQPFIVALGFDGVSQDCLCA